MKFQMVCRKWRDLISTQYFAEMHLKAKPNSSHMILVGDNFSNTYTGSDTLLLLDRWRPPRKRLAIRKVSFNFLPSSQCNLSGLSNDGLIIFHDFSSNPELEGLIIFNPITRDKVTITCRKYRHRFYGIFFNPLVKEYCMLLKLNASGGDAEFKMRNLGSQPCCRAVKHSTFLHNPRRFLGQDEPPLVIDDATLYWLSEPCARYPSCEEMIITFDIKTEEFNLMPHPGPTNGCDLSKHLNMRLLKTDGRLSFLQITVTTLSVMIDIWTLKDSTTRLWIKSHSVNINFDQLNIDRFIGQNFKVIAAGNGELLLLCLTVRRRCFRRFYACKIELGTVRMIGKAYKRSLMSSYVPSFVSLRNCKSQITI